MPKTEEVLIKEEPLNIETPLIKPQNPQQKKKIRRKASDLRNEKNKCVICHRVLIGRESIRKHYQNHTNKKIKQNKTLINKMDDNGFLKCQICLQEFVETSELLEHQENYHKDKPFMCAICNKCFRSSQQFILHMRTHEKSAVPKQCPECDFTTIYDLAYHQHLKGHPHIDDPFQCNECFASFIIFKDLNAHKRKFHPKEIKKVILNCHICQKEFTRKSRLKTHVKSHENAIIRKCVCDICGKTVGIDYLKIHKRIHFGIKPFACTYCDKKFSSNLILRDHIRTHSGEKPFACEHCGKCFSQRTPLTIHLRLHSGDRPYKCHICTKTFVSKGSLGIHLKQGKH